MLIDIVNSYDKEKREFLLSIWEKVVLHLATYNDPKKIFSFLQNVGIINIDEKEQTVYIGVSNDFILSQVKKFLGKQISETIKEIYNSQFDTEFTIYYPFANGGDLVADLKKLLQLKENKRERTIEPKIKNKLSEFFGILFDPAFSFESFVAGANNNFAFSAAKAVADNPGTAYNPLFLYGNVGLGKTHLMQAIGNKIMEDDPDKNVIYLPTTKLIDEIVESLRKNKLNSVLAKFNDIDVLLLDDVQFLSNKDKTQEIFHNIFNDFHMKKKQVILSGDRPPKELIHIEPRLKSRFGLGLVVDLKSPDYETRIAILQSKLEQKGEYIEYGLLEVIAKYIVSNVRELEGALNILITRRKFIGDNLNEKDVIAALETLGYMTAEQNINSNQIAEFNRKSKQNFGTIVEMVAQYYNISVNELKSDSRKQEITVPRQVLMLLAKEYFGRTLEKIGDYFGGKNHTSVIYAVNNIEKKIKTNKDLAHDYNVFVEWIER